MQDKYKKTIKKSFLLIFFIVFVFSSSSNAGLWYDIYQNASFEKINDVRAVNDLDQIFMVGENGTFYRSLNGGRSWDIPVNLTTEDLNCIEYHQYDNHGVEEYVLIAAGDNGAVWRYGSMSNTWQVIDTLDNVNYNTSCLDYDTIWLAGDRGTLYSSWDSGITWTNQSLPDSNLNIKTIVPFGEGIFFIAVKNDTSFLFDTYSQAAIDTIPGIEIFDSALLSGSGGQRPYFLGKNIATGENSIWFMEYMQGVQLNQIYSGDFLEATAIGGFGKEYGIIDKTNKTAASASDYTLWVTNINGYIWESRDDGQSWDVSYYDPMGRELYKIIGNSYDHDYGRVFGEGGLVLKYGFDLRYAYPGFNQSFPARFQPIELFFSHPIDLQSVESNVYLYSRLAGYLPIRASYDPGDSARIFIELQNQERGGYIPGDSWNISLYYGIIPVDYDTTTYFEAFNFDVFPEAPNPSGFNFNQSAFSDFVGGPTTNFVSALLDEDDQIDLVTYAQDSLHVFSFSADMNIQKHRTFFLGNLISVDSTMERQLLTTDVNNDAKPDIILYDRSHLVIFVNGTKDSVLSFDVENDPYPGTFIRRVSMFNGNSNTMPDMAVLDDSFNSHMDISSYSYGDYLAEIQRQPPNYRRFELADLDRDGIVDMVLLDPDGRVLFWNGSGNGHFNTENNSITSRSGYYEIRTADLDGDGELEVLALSGQQIDVYTMPDNVHWDFYQSDAWSVQSSSQIINFAVRDLGGNWSEDQNPTPDIVALTPDSLIFFNNQSTGIKQFQFLGMPSQSRAVGISADQLVIADFNMDAYPDVAVLDRYHGRYEIFTKITWKPQITNFSGSRYNVHLEWDAPPPEFGIVDHYKIYRDSIAEISAEAFVRHSVNNFFDDDEIDEFSAFWYAVQAVYQDGTESELSEAVYVENFITLNGPQTADLDDSTRTYLAQSDLSIPQGETVAIHPGVRIAFIPETGLDVYGQLQVSGAADDRMVDFYGTHKDDDYIPWKGIHIHPGADTLHFEWFSVSGADTGLFVDNCPLKMRLAGIMKNEVGLEVVGDTLAARNMVFDSNRVAIRLHGESRAEMRNIDIIRSENSIVAADQARLNLRNAIIWDNIHPVLATAPQARIDIKYSTADSLGAGVNSNHISQLPPLFMESDSMKYRPDYFSPTIDAGDPNDDFSEEPLPNGGRINQGLFGGTFMATPSYQPRISVYPENVTRSAFPGSRDTSQIFIKNRGHANLTVSAINFSSVDSVFQFNAEFPAELSPNDSMAVQIVFSPRERITYHDTLLITNNDPHVVGSVKRFALQGAGLNSAPQVLNEPVRNARAGELYEYQILASDADGDTIFFAPVQLPDWLTLSATGLVSGTPVNADAGLHNVRIAISDPFEATTVLEYRILVSPSVNQTIPIVALTPLPDNVIRQAAVRFTFDVQDSTSELTTDKRLRYILRRVSLQDTLTLFNVDTTIINKVDFYPLPDGLYIFTIWSYRSNGYGFSGEKAENLVFRVDASKRNVLPYRWHMVSFPRQEPMQWSYFGHSDSSAILLRWNQQLEEYEALNRDEIMPGSAFWVMPLKALDFDLSEFKQPEQYEESGVPIHEGWNQVGIPCGYSLYWQDMYFINSSGTRLSLQAAIDDSLLNGAVYRFSQTKEFQGYHWMEIDSNTVAWPWTGYWLKANVDGTLLFSTQPAFENQNVSASSTPVLAKAGDHSKQDFSLNLILENGKYTDAQNIIGISNKAQHLVFEPPHMGEFCALYFPAKQGHLTKDIKKKFGPDEEVKIWNMRVSGRKLHTTHFIKWDNSALQEEELYLYLVDETNETLIKMNDESEYEFSLKSEEMPFKIYASKDASFKPEIIPAHFKLAQNYPNPFNPHTTIRFGLPESASGKKVELNIYNVLGKKVATLINGTLKAGYHERVWNGYNAQGRQVASGIYFYQIRSGSVSIIKKMILIR